MTTRTSFKVVGYDVHMHGIHALPLRADGVQWVEHTDDFALVNAMAAEILTVRKLLQDVVIADSEGKPVDALHEALHSVHEYVESIS